MINQQRLWQRLMEVGEIGKEQSGGVTRAAFTKEDRAVKDLVSGYMKEAGLNVHEDAVGNLIGRKEGQNPDAPAVITGSHLDTVSHGGNFDGILGVLGGIEVLQVMKEHNIQTLYPIEVIAFTGEDAARFSGMLGSRGFTGALQEEDLQEKDEQGMTIGEAMGQAGFPPEAIAQAVRPRETVKAFVELHIEQGKVLENKGISVGCLINIYSQLKDKFLLAGEPGHGGNTPMPLRKEALMAAAEVMLAIEGQAREESDVAVTTINNLYTPPGGGIPSKVEFIADMRAASDSIRDDFEKRVLERANRICEMRDVKLTVTKHSKSHGVACDPSIQKIIINACVKAGLEPFSLSIGSGHDAMRIADLCPIGMIIVRSKDGLSHDPGEYSSPEDCRDGTNVLFYTMLQLAEAC